LDIQYDTSTFDTDPFEPQPFGQQTIFPFWVPRPSTLDVGYSPLSTPHSSRGYVELPYTLPQDSTLFLLFREPTIATWLKKLDWIVQNGGMALVNIHPDYVRFPGEPASIRTYPVELYAALLKHIRDRHAGRFWHVLPREMAQYAGKLISHKPRHRPLRVCMITHSYYSRDNRVIRYAESLAARGDHVDVLGLSSKPDVPREERLNGVNVMRLQERLSKSAASDVGYLRPILRFFFKASFWLTRHEGHRHYDLVHIHNIPDFLVFAAWYPRLRGARLILDIHDVVPEFFASKFTQPLNSWRIRALLLMERWSARFAHHVIIANHLWLRSYTTRSCPPAKCSVFINNANADLFHPQPRIRQDGRLIVMFPGGMQWHQGLDIGLRAFQKITAEFPTAEFHIYGDGNMKPQLVALAAELGLNGKVRFFDPVRVQEIARVMADADLGVVPKRADSFGNEAYSTKIMEFMFLGVPVVVSETKIDRYYFNDQVVKFFASGNHDAMAAAMSEVLRDRVNREEMVARAREYAYANSWETRKADYLKLVDDLCSA
jgi:glycosyltransferase involved in cell wall biosynthesis